MSSTSDNREISWDPYTVWRTLILGNPDLLLRSAKGPGLMDREHAMEFAMSISELPDDLQDFLFVLAQEHGIDAAHTALDNAVREFFAGKRERTVAQARPAAPQKKEPRGGTPEALQSETLAASTPTQTANPAAAGPAVSAAAVTTPASPKPVRTVNPRRDIFCRSRG